MSETTNDLIQRLAQESSPVQPVCYVRTCVEWLIMVAFTMIFVTQLYGIRPDIDVMMADPLYVIELGLNAVLIILMGCLASANAFPGRARNGLLKGLLVVCFFAYSVIVCYISFANVESLGEAVDHLTMAWECTGCILSYALLPAIYISWRLRKLATTQPVFAGFCVLLLAGLTGTFGVRIVMPAANSPDILVFHYFPLLLLCLLGLALGKKIFKW